MWSVARRGVLPTVKAYQKELVSVELSIFTAEVVREAHRCKVGWSIENPRSSGFWQFGPISGLLALKGSHFINFDSCAFGSPHQKPTSLLSNLFCLDALAQPCPKNHVHVHIIGNRMAQKAGAYESLLCTAWARAIAGWLPDLAFGVRPAFLETWEADLRRCVRHERGADVAGEADFFDPRRAEEAVRAGGIRFPRKGYGLKFGCSLSGSQPWVPSARLG